MKYSQQNERLPVCSKVLTGKIFYYFYVLLILILEVQHISNLDLCERWSSFSLAPESSDCKLHPPSQPLDEKLFQFRNKVFQSQFSCSSCYPCIFQRSLCLRQNYMLGTSTLILPQQTFRFLEMIVYFTALNITHPDARSGGTKQNNPEFQEASPERWGRDQKELLRNIAPPQQPWLALRALLKHKI